MVSRGMNICQEVTRWNKRHLEVGVHSYQEVVGKFNSSLEVFRNVGCLEVFWSQSRGDFRCPEMSSVLKCAGLPEV